MGSSGKQEKLLQALTRGLGDIARVEPWTTSFHPGTSTLERLLELTREVDFAAFAFAHDDWTTGSPPAGAADGSGGIYWRAEPDDVSILDGQDDRKRRALIAKRLKQTKAARKA